MKSEERVQKILEYLLDDFEYCDIPFIVYEDDLYKPETYIGDSFGEHTKKQFIKKTKIDKFVPKELKEAVDEFIESVGYAVEPSPNFCDEQGNYYLLGADDN
jgi:hypothetical protein